ncbi:bifunctional aspartate kinase/homoserine dehydrogenase I [Lutibacter sp. HS1-25]|uniref:bifunctional aspartate kinase/homoserine dehydrogenase I n=1 Tax=Lutibacter sp. HS1-25 TaxID=2485000 RepID=UPI00101330BA|nr:bifunctional aspartate kinase/homoserine dehydrogenase I [Lutibacter sp. HS1-25]RXP61863.1 bifunctional aspartate kinase/homoserine dehydrogenase I [Lutibacter sp. HS1-25]
MKVLKFGGSSVASSESIDNVISIVKDSALKNNVAVVVSALGGVTDLLLDAGNLACKGDESYKNCFKAIEERHLQIVRELIPINNQSGVLGQVKKMLNKLETTLEGVFLINELSSKTSDKIVSYGELLSSYIISEAFKNNNLDAQLKNTQELIVTNDHFSNAAVKFDKTNIAIESFFKQNEHKIIILPGFVAKTESGEVSTLGRGGSDYTAAIIAAAVNATVLEIWTDVSGMFTANPKVVKEAFPIKNISYQEAMELSHFGAKVLYPPTIQPVLKKEIPICIKNTFDANAEGTLITKVSSNKNPIKGISHIENMTLITLEGSGMVGIPGFSRRLFGALSEQKINISLITQASSEHSICIAISTTDVEKAKEAIENEFNYEMEQHKIDPLKIEKDNAIIALVGDNMKSHQGISGKMFSTLGRNNVNIRAIAQGASEKNISAVILHKDIKKALNALHATFFENQTKQLNLFVVGVGNVGGKLIEQIKKQQQYLLENLKLQVRVIALTNSRKMAFNEDGIDLDNWKAALDKGETLDMDLFHNKVTELNFRNSVFVDNTANESVASLYATYLKESVAVVTCNKIACSSEYTNYQHLKQLAREYDAPFLFETNVGAGLPIIDTLKNLVASGDKVTKIQAVLSGSLNFIFNNFDEKNSFSEVVKQAGIEGYTEPDPRIDLSGIDVMRKILILARESGTKLELSDIKNNSFLPQASLDAVSVPDFLETLVSEADHFNKIQQKAAANNCRLKVVAEFDNGTANVSLKEIPSDHPFYNLDGSDNIVLFFTERYSKQPLIIKGAGAGADVTASGLFADIIRIGNN